MKKRGKTLSSREAANERKIRLLQRQVQTLKKRQKYSIIKLIIKIILITLPLWAVFYLSFETDFSIELSVVGIILFFILYFGTLGMYFYFKYRRLQ